MEVSMRKHVQKAIDAFGEELSRTAATPAKNNMFEVNEKSPLLEEKRADNFHSVVASLPLFCQEDAG